MELVIELKKGEDPNITLNQLYKFTQLQTTVSIINIALVNRRPRTLGLKQMTIGLAYAHTFFPTRTVTNSAYGLSLDKIIDVENADGSTTTMIDPAQEAYFYPSANGTYNATIDKIGITVAGKFGK